MKSKVTLDRIIAFLKIYLALACCWPLPSNATRLQRLHRNALWYFCFANSTIFNITMIYTIYNHNSDTLLILKVGCQLSVAAQIPLQVLLFAMQNKRLQVRFLFLFLHILTDVIKFFQHWKREIDSLILRCAIYFTK